MKRTLILVLLLGLLSSGCAAINGENQADAFYPDGTVVKSSLTDEGMFYQAQIKKAEARKPILVMKAREGQDIVLKGVAQLTVWGYDENRGGIKQHKNQYLETLKAVAGPVGVVAGIWAQGDANQKLLNAMQGVSGTHIHGLHQNISGGSAANVNLGGGDSSTTGSQPITTTTTSEDNDVITEQP